LRSQGFSRATLRAYQVRLRLFCDFNTDPGYGWAEECWQRFGAHPQVHRGEQRFACGRL
jgi:integrase/recombinase XerC